MPSLIRAAAFVITLAAIGLLASGLPFAGEASFNPQTTIKLCAYTGWPGLTTPCSTESLTTSANADLTFVQSIPSGDLSTSLAVTMLPQQAKIPGRETNTYCNGTVDDDSDGFVNDGCPQLNAYETACSDAVDSDSDGLTNDGCPAIGEPPLGSVVVERVVVEIPEPEPVKEPNFARQALDDSWEASEDVLEYMGIAAITAGVVMVWVLVPASVVWIGWWLFGRRGHGPAAS